MTPTEPYWSHMRRLASQTRDDAYASRKDYQEVSEDRSRRFTPDGAGSPCLVLVVDCQDADGTTLGAGGFIRSSADCKLEATLFTDDDSHTRTVRVGPHWQRFGLVLRDAEARRCALRLRWPAAVAIDLYGLNGGVLSLPEAVASAALEDLRATHLCPETLYLDHGSAVALEIDDDETSSLTIGRGAPISLKKCSYCGRRLALDMGRLGMLSFHKHNDKKSKHQNECRACKKWRINDQFNPIRTTDQLHESSVITRERKLFLREPQLLRTIKERTGAGLKSQVWERFGRSCFYCGVAVALDEFQLDHTRPLAYLWPIDQYATCLCSDHNNQKSDRFPVDFYTSAQLERLSKITGLPLEDLRVKDVCEPELQRILDDLPAFAEEWDPRTFAAIARKVVEVRPEVDLFALLNAEAPELHGELMGQLEDRPEPAAG